MEDYDSEILIQSLYDNYNGENISYNSIIQTRIDTNVDNIEYINAINDDKLATNSLAEYILDKDKLMLEYIINFYNITYNMEDIQHNIKDASKIDSDGNSILHLIHNDKHSLLPYIIDNGASVWVTTKNIYKETPLYIHRNNIPLIQHMLKYEDVILKTPVIDLLTPSEDYTAPIHIIYDNNFDLFNKIIQKNVNKKININTKITIYNNEVSTVLHALLLNTKTKIARYFAELINEESGIIKDFNGDTCFHVIIKKQYYNLLKYITLYKNNVRDCHGNTILDLSVIFLNEEESIKIFDTNTTNTSNYVTLTARVISMFSHNFIKKCLDIYDFKEINNITFILDTLWQYDKLWFKYFYKKYKEYILLNRELIVVTKCKIKLMKKSVLCINTWLKHIYYKPEINGIQGGLGYYKMINSIN